MEFAELHRHLDVSVRLSTLHELAIENDVIPESESLESFSSKILITKPMTNLTEVLATFQMFQKTQTRREALERVAYEVVEDCFFEGSRLVELRFSPAFITETSGLDWDDVLNAYEAGVQKALDKYPEVKAGLICIASRDMGMEQVAKTIEFYIENRFRFCGIDLAGPEASYPCKLFESEFKRVKPFVEKGEAHITIHSGEDCGPENIWEAIELLSAQRIGHGITCVQDPKLMDALVDRKICLEMCPTSNWLTQGIKQFSEHPIPKVLRHGIPVCINTDDPTPFATNLPKEVEIVRNEMGLSDAELEQCFDHARNSSFLKEANDPT